MNLLRSTVWINASAGSGKTKSLVDRFLSLALTGVRVDKIWCVTFTKVAAAEMRERIAAELKRWTLMNDCDLRERVASLLRLAPSASVSLSRARELRDELRQRRTSLKIGTMHSFAQTILSELGGVRVAPEWQQRQIRANAVKQITETIVVERFPHLLHEFSEKKVRLLLDDCFDLLQLRVVSADQRSAYEEQVRALLDSEQESCSVEDLLRRNPDVLARAPDQVKEALSDGDYLGVFLTKSGEPRKNLLKKPFSQDAELVRLCAEVQSCTIKARNYRLAQEECSASMELFDLAIWLQDVLSIEKQKYNVVDYNDLLDQMQQLLHSEEDTLAIKQRIASQVDHVLIDEAQDMNFKQWSIIVALAEDFVSCEKTFFVVGDEKQSIYNFQGATPQLFHQMKSLLKAIVENVGQDFVSSSLNQCYRCDARLLEFVDRLFASMNRDGKSFHSQHVSNIRNKYESCLEFLPMCSAAAIAEIVANEWKSEPEEILLLIRSRTDLMHDVIHECGRLGVTVVGDDKVPLRNHLAVHDLLCLLRFVALQADDYSLGCVLKSPICCFTEEDLMDLCKRPEDERLWSALVRRGDEPQFARALATLRSVLSGANMLSARQTLLHALVSMNLLDRFVEEFGMQVLEPIDQLLQMTDECGPANQHLLHFISFMDYARVDLNSQCVGPIRFTTIHGAKGAEAEVVILVDEDVGNPPETKALMLPEGVAIMRSGPMKSSAYKVIRESLIEEGERERRRLLYVALTRCKGRMIVLSDALS